MRKDIGLRVLVDTTQDRDIYNTYLPEFFISILVVILSWLVLVAFLFMWPIVYLILVLTCISSAVITLRASQFESILADFQ